MDLPLTVIHPENVNPAAHFLQPGNLAVSHVSLQFPDDSKRQIMTIHNNRDGQLGMPALDNPRDVYMHSDFPGSISSARTSKRASQACDSCRKLKVKCDEGKQCSSCQEKNVECTYREQDMIQMEIQKELREIRRENNLLQGRVSQLEIALKRVDPTATADFSSLDYSPVDFVKTERQQSETLPSFTHPSASRLPSIESGHIPHPTGPVESPAAYHDRQEQEEEEGGELIPLGESVLPVNHTTGATRLLLWGAIQKITGPIVQDSRIKNEEYAMNQEEKRGLLRTAGRGEGLDLGYGYDKNPMNNNPSPERADDVGFDGSPYLATDALWGQGGGLNPAPPTFMTRGADDRHRGLGDQDGLLELDPTTVMRLVESYMSHMNIMHPILSPKKFRVLVQRWLATVPVAPRKVTSPEARFGKNSAATSSSHSRGTKRNRSSGLQEQQEPASASPINQDGPARTITTALVMVVLALGRICEYREKIPDVLPTSDTTSNCSPAIRNGFPLSPLQNPPPISSQTSILSSQRVKARAQIPHRRSSLEAMHPKEFTPYIPARNWDVIPGLTYFHIAMEIAGSQLGGNSLEHVHVYILAALYHGQLARVLESYEYIRLASARMQTLLRPRLERFQNLLPSDLDSIAKCDMNNRYQSNKGEATMLSGENELLIAFWTILQLESDILAELPCVPSGILLYEGIVPYPDYDIASAADMEGEVYRSYIDQLYMRKHLNWLHSELYKSRDSRSKSKTLNNTAVINRTVDALHDSISTFADLPNGRAGFDRAVEAFEENLSFFQRMCGGLSGPELSPPATDILTARLRAKFYGAQVITYRPYVQQILELSSPSAVSTGGSSGAANASKISSFENAKNFIGTSKFHKYMQYAEKGIRALTNSTRAFHGLGNSRLIVTNVWGTAHAQWGNLLVLQAAYRDPLLSHLIDGKELKLLLTKTLEFLKMHAQPSSSLALDVKILEYAGQQTGLLRSSSKPAHLRAAGPNKPFTSAGS